MSETQQTNLKQATFGGGCFWCTEAIFQNLVGVDAVTSGYAGGELANPTYEQICTGTTGHAEVIQVHFAPEIISYQDLLSIFWQTHDPTSLNRQGNDIGTQYRSVVFYHDDSQRQIAEELKSQLDNNGTFELPIVTEISPLDQFYPAEGYHQNYFQQHTEQPYCQAVILPKLVKFKTSFAEKLKPTD